MDPYEFTARLVEEHAATLVDQAQELVSQHPNAHPVGLILEAGASEAIELQRALEQATGEDLAGRGFVGLVPREFALELIRANAPAALDWLEPKTEGPERKLPVLVATRDGYRVAALDYRVGDPD